MSYKPLFRRSALDTEIDIAFRAYEADRQHDLDSTRSYHYAPHPTVTQKPGMYRSYPNAGTHLLGFFLAVALTTWVLWHFLLAPVIELFEGF